MNFVRTFLVLSISLAVLFGCDSGTSTEGSSPGECADGADNDSDGDYDCNDSDCYGAPDCIDTNDSSDAADSSDASDVSDATDPTDASDETDPTVTEPVCGNGEIEEGEACDDGNLELEVCDYGVQECVVCDGDCNEVDGAISYCGDAVQNGPEQCDDGNTNELDACLNDCTLNHCGNGIIESEYGEQCDDGVETAACDGNCTEQICGDGWTNEAAGEQCDDGNVLNTDACVGCLNAICGDNHLWEGVEECDQGEETASCNGDCTASVCGDGWTNAMAGEECDDENNNFTDDCIDCVQARCGDGFVNASNEDCDEGEETSTCDGDCTVSFCGDGWLNILAGEDCDDGNDIPFDGCEPTCLITAPKAIALLRLCGQLDGNGNPIEMDCISEGTIEPLSRVYLDASNSFSPSGGAIVEYSWELVAGPSIVGMNLDWAGNQDAVSSFWVPIAGDYTVRLTVWDDSGRSNVATEQSDITFTTLPESQVHVLLVWDHPSNDQDLHLTHVSANGHFCSTTKDCFFSNKQPQWFSTHPAGEGPNPRLDLDDTNGLGPEIINIDEPAAGRYRIFTHYYPWSSAGAPTIHTVSVFLNGVMSFNAQRTLTSEEQVWAIADIIWEDDATEGGVGYILPYPGVNQVGQIAVRDSSACYSSEGWIFPGEEVVTPAPCGVGQFACESGAECLPDYYACDGLAQCSDSSDEDADICEPEEVYEVTDETCSDGIDNNLNGYTDCSDTSCLLSCEVSVCQTEETGNCSDGLDNDGDGYVDCDDYRCACDSVCL